MKRSIGKRITSRIREFNEDMRELQRMMRHQSVYAKVSVKEYSRRPKHPKSANYFDYIEY